LRPLEGFGFDLDELQEKIEEALGALVAYGDLIEEREVSQFQGPAPRVLFTAPPSFVSRQSGLVLLLGIASDQVSPLPDELVARIDFARHVRRLRTEDETVAMTLMDMGLIQIPIDSWMMSPALETPSHHLRRMDDLLDDMGPSGEVPGLSLIDPAKPVRFYKGRWVEPTNQNGRFVGRRKQAYGADLWCYVEMDEGTPLRFIDFPLKGSRARGCDEAWHLQSAIDACRGRRQVYRKRQGSGPIKIFDFFSPVPGWARRRWDAFGEPLDGMGCLFSYSFEDSEVPEEEAFVCERLWLEELP